MKLGKEIGLSLPVTELSSNAAMKKHIIGSLDACAQRNKFNRLEYIKALHIETRPFAELNIMTTTFKIQRHLASQLYKSVIDQLYSSARMQVVS